MTAILLNSSECVLSLDVLEDVKSAILKDPRNKTAANDIKIVALDLEKLVGPVPLRLVASGHFTPLRSPLPRHVPSSRLRFVLAGHS